MPYINLSLWDICSNLEYILNFAEAKFPCDEIELYDQTSTKIYPTDLTEIPTKFCLFVKLDTIGRLSQRAETHVPKETMATSLTNRNRIQRYAAETETSAIDQFLWLNRWLDWIRTEFCFCLDWPLVPGGMYVFVFFVITSLKKR